MNIKNKLWLTLGSVGAAGAVGAAVLLCGKALEKEVILPEAFTITAHTGCEGTKDNTLDSITVGFVSGADVVEFDLYFNAQGVPVLSHDEPVGGEVTLDEAFRHVATFPGLKVNVDVKNIGDFTLVEELAKKYGIKERVFFTGVSSEFAQDVIASGVTVPYYLNVNIEAAKSENDEYISSLIDEAKALGAIGLNFRYTGCSKKLVDKCHENDLLVSIWTVNNRFDMKKALSYGADNITTKKPVTFAEILAPYIIDPVTDIIIEK